MSDGMMIALFLLAWPAFLLVYWIFLQIAPRKTLNVFYDMDVVDPHYELDKKRKDL